MHLLFVSVWRIWLLITVGCRRFVAYFVCVTIPQWLPYINNIWQLVCCIFSVLSCYNTQISSVLLARCIWTLLSRLQIFFIYIVWKAGMLWMQLHFVSIIKKACLDRQVFLHVRASSDFQKTYWSLNNVCAHPKSLHIKAWNYYLINVTSKCSLMFAFYSYIHANAFTVIWRVEFYNRL